MPEMILMVTLLPAPLSPHSAVTIPDWTVRSTPASALTAPKLFSTPRNSSNGCPRSNKA